MFYSCYELFYDGSLFEIDFFFSFNFLIFFLFIILYFFLYIFIEFYYLFGTFDIFLYGSFSTIFNFDFKLLIVFLGVCGLLLVGWLVNSVYVYAFMSSIFFYLNKFMNSFWVVLWFYFIHKKFVYEDLSL